MNLDICKKAGAAVLSMLIVAGSVATFNAADTVYAVDGIDGMSISLPSGMNAVTRKSTNDDKYFLIYGLNYDTAMQNFKTNDIYLQGMNNTATVTLTVTMTETEESKTINNYNVFRADKLSEIQNNFLDLPEYIACTPDQAGTTVWLNFSMNIENGQNNIKAYQANTICNGKNINITYQRNSGEMTSDDYKIFSNIVSSVKFKEDTTFSKYLDMNNIEFYILFGGLAVILAFLIILIVLSIRSHNRKKRKDNSRILEELAVKYQLDEDKEAKRAERLSMFENFEEKTISEDDETDEEEIEDISDIVYFDMKDEGTSTFDTPSDDEAEKIIDEVKNIEDKPVKNNIELISEYFEDADDTDTAWSEDVSEPEQAEDEEAFEEVEEEPETIQTEQAFEDETQFDDEFEDTKPLQNEFDSECEQEEETEELVSDNEAEVENTAEVAETPKKKIFVFDEDVAVSQINNSLNFDDSDDFFEEAPTKKNGVISASAIRDAEDYDVISEVEEIACQVEKTEPVKESKALGAAKKVGGSIKYFGVHCGYFCTNVYRMVKRKNAAKKRKKAELERQELRKRREAQLRQQRARQANGELVKVHSRTDRRPAQRSSAKTSPTKKKYSENIRNKRR